MMLDKQALEYLLSTQSDQPDQLPAKILLHDSTCFNDVRSIQVGGYTLDMLYNPPDEHNVMANIARSVQPTN